MKMKTNLLSRAGRALSLCIPLFTLSTAQMASAQSSTPSTVEVGFGDLYGYEHDIYPTTVFSGTGTLGQALVGHNFYWVCLDITQEFPDPFAFPEEGQPAKTYSFSVSQNVDILSAGDLWGSKITDLNTRESISQAVSNMFFAFKAEIIADTGSNGGGNTYGSAFQMAIWYLTRGYDLGEWSGTVNQEVIDHLLTWTPEGSTVPKPISQIPLIEDLLRASLISSGGQQQIFFANPDDSSIQPIAFLVELPIPIPEPSSVVLLGVAGAAIALRRFRSRS